MRMHVRSTGMNSFRVLKNKTLYIVAAFAMAISIAVPALVQAAQVTTRSIELSSSSAAAENVTYTVNFTAATAAGAFVVDFCSNSPLIPEACTAPTDFVATGTTSPTSGVTGVTTLDANTVIVETDITAAENVSVALAGIKNTSTVGPMYARIITYDTAQNATDNYISTALGAGSKDSGSVAISIANTIGVSGAVLESMTFCVSGQLITANCASTTTPVLKLGETVGSVTALVPGVLSTGSIFTQISTNASGGAVVSLKSGANNCGGLIRAGAPSACDILPALQTGVAAGEAKFGVRAEAIANTGANPTGTFQTVPASGYNDTTYALNYASPNATGVTSTYGDPFLNTAGAPANNKNMQLTFGVSISNNTPAGLYSADVGLIATGKF